MKRVGVVLTALALEFHAIAVPALEKPKTMTGRIEELDVRVGNITVKGKDGQMEFKANEKAMRDIDSLKVGDKVVVEYSGDLALSVSRIKGSEAKKAESTGAKKDTRGELDSLLSKAIRGGFIHKIESYEGIPIVWVASSFYTLTIDGKENLMKVVYARYAMDKPNLVVVILRDAYSGKSIGKFTKFDGLILD